MGMWARVAVVFAVLVSLSSSVEASGRGRHKSIYMTKVKGKVTIDARLEDWDLSGQILSYVVPETQTMQSVRTAMMYDAEAFYICGIVRDTSPMMNRHDPKTDPEKAWDADVCQIFYSLDPDAGYPVKYSSFNKEDKEVPAATMMLWYYTDRQEACLSMFQAMGFSKPLQPEMGVRGVIDPKYYEGAYRKTEDGGGYIFEYRIPWTTMKLTRTPKEKDLLALSMAVFWSRPDGLKTAGGAAWAYDVMSGPGFSFQSASCWGKAVFYPGNDVPKELVTAGQPPEKPLPLTFEYTLPDTRELHETSVQLYNEKNEIVRMLVPQQMRRAGKNTELWDGLNDQGAPLPEGKYRWKGIIHDPITTKWRLSVHNSGTPPYPTPDNRGGWGGDHGTPQSVTALKDGMILSWNVCEFGWGIIRVDLEGKKVWGSKHNATYLANDGQRLFIAGGHGFHQDPSVQILDLADSRPMSLANGKPSYAAPEGGTVESNEVTGLDSASGILYVSYKARNLIAAFRVEDAAITATYAVPAPERLAVLPDGSLAVISGGKVVSVKDGAVSDLITTHLDTPVSVEAGPDGTLYVANRGALQNISVFDAAGTYLRSLGKTGGRPATGRYDASGLYMPGGMELDVQGRLWVAETTDGPKRIAVWDTKSGANLKEFFGSSDYFAYGFINPEEPEMMYAHHVLWKIDWKKNTGTPYSTIWRKTAPDMMEAPSPCGYSGVLKMVTAENGQVYAWGNSTYKSVLTRREGDLFKPFAAVINMSRGHSLFRGTGLPMLDNNKETYPDGQYLWQDGNDDQRIQPEEIVPMPKLGWSPNLAWFNKDLSVRLSTGHILRPVEVRGNGQPVYDLNKVESTFLVGNALGGGYLTQSPDGAVYTFGTRKGPSLIRWNAEGGMDWYYPDIVRWHDALNLAITGPGKLWGMTGCMGVAGRYLAHMTYFGSNHLFRDDGMYVAALLKDGRVSASGGTTDTDEGQPEGQNGQFVKLTLEGKERYFIIHGGQDSRVWEVLGLETVSDLEGGIYEHTAALVEEAKKGMAEYDAALAKSAGMVIARGRSALDVAGPIGRAVDAERSFEARLAYDAENLYVKFEVTSPVELINGQPEPKILFRGGNCLDIQLATDPAADSARKTPAPGDLRILITRKEQKTFAMLYRPRIEGFTGEPFVFTSPTGKESFDSVSEFTNLTLDYRKTAVGYQATVTLPLASLGLTLKAGEKVRMDVGVLFGNETGTRTTARTYAKNMGFSAGVTNDIPNESRLTPEFWGVAEVE